MSTNSSRFLITSHAVSIGAAMMLFAPGAFADGTGWFSSVQVEPGRWEYSQKCSDLPRRATARHRCAGAEGSAASTSNGTERPCKDFYSYVHDQMPLGQGGALDDQEYADIVAYVLAQNGVPAANEKLTPNSPMDRVLT